MRHIGNVTAPTKALAKFEVAKEMVGDEKPERRSAVEVEQTDTGVMLYSCQEYLFTAKTILLEQTNNTAVAADSDRGDKRSKCVHLQKCHIKKSRSCEHCPFFKAAKENNTTSDGGKVDYFRCRLGECDKCARRSSCEIYGQCDYCFAYGTNFCCGCSYDDSFI